MNIFLLVAAVSFNQSNYFVDENAGPAQPVLVLDYPATFDISIIVNDLTGVNGGTATGKITPLTNTTFLLIISGGAVDYGSGPYMVTFPAGSTTSSFDIPITDDDVVEDDETIVLSIQTASLPSEVYLGRRSETTVYIRDTTSNAMVTHVLLITHYLLV